MFIMDVPSIPAQETTLMVTDASMTQNTVPQYDRVIGVCHLSENPYDRTSAVNSMSVADEAVWYLEWIKRVRLD